MRIEHRQVEGQPLTVIIEYPKWSESVNNLVKISFLPCLL